MGKIPKFKAFYEAAKAGEAKLLHGVPHAIFPLGAANAYTKFACGIVAEAVCLAARSLGLWSRIVAIPSLAFAGEKASYFKKRPGFASGYEVGLAVPVGDEEGKGNPTATDKAKSSYI